MPTCHRSIEPQVCAWPGHNAPWPTQNKLRRSSTLHVICLNEVNAVQIWGRLTIWQTWCLNPLLFAISQVPCWIWTFLQALWSSFQWLLVVYSEKFSSVTAMLPPACLSHFLSRKLQEKYLTIHDSPIHSVLWATVLEQVFMWFCVRKDD